MEVKGNDRTDFKEKKIGPFLSTYLTHKDLWLLRQ